MTAGSDFSDMLCGEIGNRFVRLLNRTAMMQTGLMASVAVFLMFTAPQYIIPVAQVAIGSTAMIFVWRQQKNPGLPILPMISLQTFLVYALPMIAANEAIVSTPIEALNRATLNVMLFGLFMAFAWRATAQRPSPKSIEVWVFSFVDGKHAHHKLVQLSLQLLAGSLCFEIARLAGLLGVVLNLLPNGFGSIFQTLSEAAAMGGGLLGGFTLGTGASRGSQRAVIWSLFVSLFLIHISGFLLSTATGLMCATTLGLLIGRGKVPAVFLVIMASTCFFFNLTKFEMRARYWDPESGYVNHKLTDLPLRFLEWSELSFAALFTNSTTQETDAEQSLADRVNNLSILLFVQNAHLADRIPVVAGKTYTLIPELLIPRVFWPDKPRAHAGQELLNTHFGRQTLEETFRTYIAWGLLAEAYGNFGHYWGAIILGTALGMLIGRIEAISRPYPLRSLQAFLLLAFMVRLGTAFEMVASVFVTSTFQQLVAITGISYFLVNKRRQPYPPNRVIQSAPSPTSSSLD